VSFFTFFPGDTKDYAQGKTSKKQKIGRIFLRCVMYLAVGIITLHTIKIIKIKSKEHDLSSSGCVVTRKEVVTVGDYCNGSCLI